jgi:hypothetical protein
MAWTEDDTIWIRRAIALAHDGEVLPGKNQSAASSSATAR